MLLSSLKLHPILDWDVQFANPFMFQFIKKKRTLQKNSYSDKEAHKNQNNLEF